jgi:hypothetical protein
MRIQLAKSLIVFANPAILALLSHNPNGNHSPSSLQSAFKYGSTIN